MTETATKWTETRIADLGKVVTGKTPPTSQTELFGDTYAFITPTDIQNGLRIVCPERGLSERGRQYLRNYLLPPNAVCFVCIGATIGKICMTDRPSFTNQQINSVVVDSNRHNPYFAYYLLKHNAHPIKTRAGGAATPIVNKTAFENVRLPVPPLQVQDKIAAVLSAYDNLIENNARRIRILEEMAQAIYREWFVGFHLPDHEKVKMVESAVGLIPEGWEVRPIGDVVETAGGGTPSTKQTEYWDGGHIVWFTPSDLTSGRSMFIANSEKRITAVGLKQSSARLFPAYSVMMTSRATIGVTAINTAEACTNQGFITCIPNDRLSIYQIYYWIQENLPKIQAIASGATYKEINRTEFRGLPIVVPPATVSRLFLQTVEPIAKQIENLLSKNANLRETRDLLLPMLISGEVDVSKVDIIIGGSA